MFYAHGVKSRILSHISGVIGWMLHPGETMANLHYVEDSHGDVVDYIIFCSHFCQLAQFPNDKWNGCHEIPLNEPCAECGEIVEGIE